MSNKTFNYYNSNGTNVSFEVIINVANPNSLYIHVPKHYSEDMYIGLLIKHGNKKYRIINISQLTEQGIFIDLEEVK